MATNATANNTTNKAKTNTNTATTPEVATVGDEATDISTPVVRKIAVGTVDDENINVGTLRVSYSELERTIAQVGYWNILQIIVEPSYSGAYFVVIYVKK